MVTRQKRFSAASGPLMRSDMYEDWILRPAWYAVLNEHLPFRQTLKALRKEQQRKIPNSAIAAFVARWPGVADKDVADWLSADDQAAPLSVRSRNYIGGGGLVFITPPALEGFRYSFDDDPTKTRAEVRKRAKAVETEMLRQMDDAKKQWKAAGLRPVHPRHRYKKDATGRPQPSEDLQLGMRRLFQHVIRRWSWQRIGRAEFPDPARRQHEPVLDSHIRDQVTRYAAALGIALPGR